MVYMGSKEKHLKDLIPIIQKKIDDENFTVFIDCCAGGANLTDKINCENVYGIDLSPTLISLHQQAQKDFSLIPEDGSREMWDENYSCYKKLVSILKTKKFSQFTEEDFKLIGKEKDKFYEIGAIEWYASFSRGGFPRGYAKNTEKRNYYKEAYRNHQKQIENENYKKINFLCGDYEEKVNEIINSYPEGTKIMVYVDMPYKNTKPYSIAPKFDYFRMYEWIKNIAKTCPVFVSEQELTAEFDKYLIFEKETKRTCGRLEHTDATEKLWLVDRRDET